MNEHRARQNAISPHEFTDQELGTYAHALLTNLYRLAGGENLKLLRKILWLAIEESARVRDEKPEEPPVAC